MTTSPRPTKTNVVTIAAQKTLSAKRVRRPKKSPAHPSRTAAATTAILGVCVVLIGLSLSHLAEGVQLVTGSGTAAAWSMAVGIDLAFVALEVALLVSPDDIRPAVSRYASPAIVGTLAVSAAMNAFAFASHAQGLMIYPAIGLGFAVPALIFALTKTAATLAFHKA
jgi:hypothetical protein